MSSLRRSWTSPRPKLEQHLMGVASYNAGVGSIIRAQTLCAVGPVTAALFFSQIAPCLPRVTGNNAKETITYVARIQQWRKELEGF